MVVFVLLIHQTDRKGPTRSYYFHVTVALYSRCTANEVELCSASLRRVEPTSKENGLKSTKCPFPSPAALFSSLPLLLLPFPISSSLFSPFIPSPSPSNYCHTHTHTLSPSDRLKPTYKQPHNNHFNQQKI